MAHLKRLEIPVRFGRSSGRGGRAGRVHLSGRILGLLLCLPLGAHYDSDNFSAYNARWVTNSYLGRDGIIWPGNSWTTVHHSFGAGVVITGEINTGFGGTTTARNGYWKTVSMYNTNKYASTDFEPFGFEIIRTNSKLFHNPGDARNQADSGIWLFVSNPGFSPVTEWNMVENFMEFYDTTADWDSINHTNEIGCFDGVVHGFSFTNLATSSTNVNLTNQVLWDYGLATARPNTNKIGFRMVHDGSSIRFFVNPDPFEIYPGYPNEWIELGSRPVFWKSNMQIQISVAKKKYDTALLAQTTYTNFLIRSATSGSAFLFDPGVPEGPEGARTVTFLVSNLLEVFPTNAGVNFVRVDRPANGEFLLDGILRSRVTLLEPGTGREIFLRTVPFDGTRMPGPDEVGVMTDRLPRELRFVFGRQLTGSPGTPGATFRLALEVKGDPSRFFDRRMDLFVNAEQFEAMSHDQKNRYSTCGWQRSRYAGELPPRRLQALGAP